MAIEDFANCYANQVGTSVDNALDTCNRLGADAIKTLVAWYNTLPDGFKAVLAWFAGYASNRLGKILAAVIGVEAADLVVAFLGGASWEILIAAFVNCESQL